MFMIIASTKTINEKPTSMVKTEHKCFKISNI